MFLKQFSLEKDHPIWTITGITEWSAFLDGQITKKEALELWRTHEMQYARRQETWFKKMADLNYFDPTSPDAFSAIVALLQNWYAKECED